MDIKRRDFIRSSGMLAIAGGASAAFGAGCDGANRPETAGVVRVSQDVPVLGDYDVCVVGAGPGGVGAAIAAARAGKRTILVEHYGYPGGVGTNCNSPTFFYDSYKGQQYIKGIADEFIRRLAKRGAAWYNTKDERYQPDYSRPIGDGPIIDRVRTRVEDMRVAYHDFLDEVGVEKLFYTHLTGVVRDGGRITAAIVDCLEGPRAIRAKMFIDATGSAHLVHRAGGRTRQAPPDETMHKSIWATLSPGPHDTLEVFNENRRIFNDLYRNHRERLPENVWTGLAIGLASGYVNGDGCDSRDMTRMDAEMRRRNFELLECYKRELKGFEDAYIISAIHQLGVRSGRHIIGRATVDKRLVTTSAMPDDPVMPFIRQWGEHAASMKHGFGGAVHGQLDGLGAVPYGALVPVDFTNVLACGLCISVEEDYVKTIRMMPHCLTTGQVAGTAAALSLDIAKGDAGAVPYVHLRKRLEKQNHFFA
jgi:hypothetical protein